MADQDFLIHMDTLFRYALFLARNKADAEDLLQETYARAFKSKEAFHPNADPKAWLFTILRNIWFNELRRRRALPPFLDLEVNEGYGGNPPTVSKDPLALRVASEERDLARKAVQELSPILREIIVLREYEDLSYQEIARVLGCPLGTVMSRLARARAKLRHLLGRAWARDSAGEAKWSADGRFPSSNGQEQFAAVSLKREAGSPDLGI